MRNRLNKIGTARICAGSFYRWDYVAASLPLAYVPNVSWPTLGLSVVEGWRVFRWLLMLRLSPVIRGVCALGGVVARV